MLIYLLISICVIFGLVYMLTNMTSKADEKKYSEVMAKFDSLQVSKFQLDLGSGDLKYWLKGDDKTAYNYTVPNV